MGMLDFKQGRCFSLFLLWCYFVVLNVGVGLFLCCGGENLVDYFFVLDFFGMVWSVEGIMFSVDLVNFDGWFNLLGRVVFVVDSCFFCKV